MSTSRPPKAAAAANACARPALKVNTRHVGSVLAREAGIGTASSPTHASKWMTTAASCGACSTMGAEACPAHAFSMEFFIKDANTYACPPAARKNSSAGPHPCMPSDTWMPRRFADAATARATFERATWIDEQTLLWPAGGRYFFYHTLADGVFPLWWLGLMGGRGSWNGSKDSTDRRVFVHTPPQEEPVLSPHSLWSELWESVSQFPPLTTAAGRTPFCAPDQKSDAAVRADKRKYEAIFETVGNVTCFRELVVGSGTQTINQNSRFGHVNTKPDAFDAACHPYHVIAWSRFGTHAAVPVPRFNGTVVFANRGSNLNRVIADTKGSVSAALAAAKNWRSDATVDEFLFESLSAKETAARISNVSVLIVPAGAGIFNAMFLPAGAAVVVVFQRGTSACFWHQFMGVLADMGVLPVACAPDSGGPQPKDCHGWKGNELHHAKRGGEKLINLAPDVLRGCVDEAISKMVATERVPNRRTRYRAPPMLNETVGFPERALAFWNREPLRSQPVEYCNAFQAVSSKPPDASMDPPEKLNGFKGLKNTRGIKCADHRRKSWLFASCSHPTGFAYSHSRRIGALEIEVLRSIIARSRDCAPQSSQSWGPRLPLFMCGVH